MDTLQILILVSQFNEQITDNLLFGAQSTLEQKGVPSKQITVEYVPGAFELPGAAAKAASMNKWDAIICLGCVIKGQTPHFDFISQGVATNLGAVATQYHIPVIFGVITTLDMQQAIARSQKEHNHPTTNDQGKMVHENKGSEAALCAISMCHTYKRLDSLAKHND